MWCLMKDIYSSGMTNRSLLWSSGEVNIMISCKQCAPIGAGVHDNFHFLNRLKPINCDDLFVEYINTSYKN